MVFKVSRGILELLWAQCTVEKFKLREYAKHNVVGGYFNTNEMDLSFKSQSRISILCTDIYVKS